jgi:hypothetical protein
MKTTLVISVKNRGSSLMETVIAMGVLAIAIPLVFGAIGEAGKSTIASEAETHSTWIVPACMDEIQASRDGKPEYFTATAVSETFPSAGDVWAIGFSAEGKPVGKVSKASYDQGTLEADGKPIRYIASLSAAEPDAGAGDAQTAAGETPVLRARIAIEFPATAPAAKRQKLDFYTRIP